MMVCQGAVQWLTVKLTLYFLELDIPPHMVPPNPDDSDSMSLTIFFLLVILT